MKKVLTILAVLVLLALPGYARSVPAVGNVDGVILHTIQVPWEIADEHVSANVEPNALSVTTRTKLLVDAAIATDVAASGATGDEEISIYPLDSEWNAIRLRAIGITDGGTRTDQIYFGSLGGGKDCELSHAGQLAWVIGTQQSVYDQITFTSGGTFEPKPGDLVTGVTSKETAVVVSTTLSGGSWAAGNAAGTICYKSASGAFTAGGENISIVNNRGQTQGNVLSHAASDLIDFELADTVVLTAGAWGSTWGTVSPADNTNAEMSIDIRGTDIMVVVTSDANCDSKLLIKGY